MKFLTLLVALLLAAPAFAQSASAGASQKANESPALAQSASPFLWQVQGPKARHTLMGSVHLLPASAHPLPASLEAAYADSRALLLETDLDALSDPELQTRMLAAARDDRPGGLKARIGAPLYAKLQKRAEHLGMPLPACADLRGWFCALTLELFPLQQAEFTAEYGLDQYFYARAREDGRPIAGLESAAQQTELFTGINDALSTQMIRESLDDKAYASQTPAELLRLWRTGDVAALERLMKDMKTRYPQLHERLLAARNRAWVPTLAQALDGEVPTLVIVGAGHIVGTDGLLALLRARGYEVKPAPTVIEVAAPPKR